MTSRVLAVLLALAPLPVLADAPAADGCAATLPADARMIYDAARPNVKPGANVEDELKAAARPLVMGGKLSRSEARPAAEAAGKCLVMLTR
ncbi:hypothetical protein [Azospirillum halopraeferens]|uniref:hypothetical protein n=1 Tax=Azospirillum halopraeferens TaxID=34010 RepID=UPI00040460B0|nr:hypothetical protein [Azospirillum halopraeferens]